MLTSEEQKFLDYWQENRFKEKSIFRQMSLGLQIGFLISIGLIVMLASGWYSRATMVANSQSTPIVLLIGIIGISIFCSVFFKRHRWEMNEQRYKELQHKQNREGAVQHESPMSSPIHKQSTE